MPDQKNNQAHPDWQGVNTGKFFLGLLILVIGICYLGESFGIVTINVGYIFQHFWSILLIFLGLSMLSRKSRPMTILGLGITAVVLIGLFYIATNDSAFPELKRFEKIEVASLPGVLKSHIRIDSQAAALKIEGVPADNLAESTIGTSTMLLAGTFQSTEMNLKTTSNVADQTQNIFLNTRDQNSQFGWLYFGKNIGNFNLKLNEQFPAELEINSAAADINLDLVKVLASSVAIKSAASNIMINLGDQVPQVDINIQSRASAVTARIPRSSGVEIKFSSAISSKTLPDFISHDGFYQSKNFANASKHVSIILDSPLSSFDVVWK